MGLGGRGKKIAAEPRTGSGFERIYPGGARASNWILRYPRNLGEHPGCAVMSCTVPGTLALGPSDHDWFSTATARFLAASGPKRQRTRGTSAVAGRYLRVPLWRERCRPCLPEVHASYTSSGPMALARSPLVTFKWMDLPCLEGWSPERPKIPVHPEIFAHFGLAR
jgi:hypothetical protein